jgi:hypothetical protein
MNVGCAYYKIGMAIVLIKNWGGAGFFGGINCAKTPSVRRLGDYGRFAPGRKLKGL